MNDPADDQPDIALLLVEQFYFTKRVSDAWLPWPDGKLGLHRYLVSFVGIPTDDLCRIIADTISDVAALGITMDQMQGFVFLNSIIHEAVHEEAGIGFMPLMPWQERPNEIPWLLMHSPPEGGVEIGYGDDDPWDPTIWQLRFSERWVS
jgi:hypothetical protein